MQQAPTPINKSDLIERLSLQQDLQDKAAEEAVRELIHLMIDTLTQDGRVEVRGFGSLCLHHREARQARNPRTGEIVSVCAKAVPHFKPGKALREAVNDEAMHNH
ncbi:MAG: HU family DNA-binding protein [Moraxella sp.]|nr:HU family DNA-binding protein [Moraxella sp.]